MNTPSRFLIQRNVISPDDPKLFYTGFQSRKWDAELYGSLFFPTVEQALYEINTVQLPGFVVEITLMPVKVGA